MQVNGMRANIMVIEDDREISDLIAMYLVQEGVDVVQVENAERGLELLGQEDYDLVILDLNLPGMDGYEFLHRFREGASIPVVVVSARVDDSDMILGFGYGADDFVQKPFSPKVLAARIRAHLRRENRSHAATGGDEIRFGQYSYRRDDMIIKKDGQRVRLSPKELKLLDELIRNEGRPMSQEKLYETVWGNQFGDLTTVSVHIQRLRKKIEDNYSEPRYLKTVYGFGYMFSREDDDPSS